MLERNMDISINETLNKCIHEIFEEQVEQHPHSLALVMGNEKLSYQELNTRANKLARAMIKRNITKSSVVAILMHKSVNVIISILAILKTGAAYLPIDVEYPDQRREYILRDSKATIVITEEKLLDKVPSCIEKMVVNEAELEVESVSNLEQLTSPQDLAYIIYTSGTTGNPKGTLLRHIGIINLNLLWKNDFKINNRDNVGQFASIAFDASVWEIFMALLNGATLHLFKEEIIRNFRCFEEYVSDQEITVITLPPTYAIHIEPDNVKSLRILITAGSSTSKSLVNKWCKKLSYINAYGPTEASICSTYWIAPQEEFQSEIVPIGFPVYNSTIYIMNEGNRRLENGEIGELCIGGIGLAKGYLNQEVLTNEKFVMNPFIKGEKIYKSGDLARILPDGKVEYHGRIDQQVKIRGHRVELGEIEATLLKHKEVKEVAVLAKLSKEDELYLNAFYVPKVEGTTIDLIGFLKEHLPHYMIPSHCEAIEALPLTINGKVDKSILIYTKPKTTVKKDAGKPENYLQQILLDIFKAVIGEENIGINDDFYELGGDSIKAIQIAAKAYALGYKLDVKDILTQQNILNISSKVKSIKGTVEQGAVTGKVPLSPIQIWFFNQGFANINHWNQSMMLFNKVEYNLAVLRSTFLKIVEQHDALRMIYEISDNKISQINRGLGEKTFNFMVIEVPAFDSREFIYEKVEYIQSTMNISKGPLMQVCVFRTEQGDHLYISIHHLLIDGISYRILIEDIVSLYEKLIMKEDAVAEVKTSSFKSWTMELETYSRSQELLEEIPFWLELEKKDKRKKLSKNVILAENSQVNKECIVVSWPKDYTNKLITQTNKAYNTKINDILLTALALALQECFGGNQFVINLESHGRHEIFESLNISRTIGWFTSQFPLVLNLEKNCSLSSAIKVIKEQIRKIPKEGIGYEILKYLTPVELKKEISFSITPQINFNYLGQIDIDLCSQEFGISEYIDASSLGPDGKSNIGRENEIYFPLNITSFIEKGIFHTSFSFNKNQFNRNEIRFLSEKYKDWLKKIIVHCVDKKNTENTPSDFTHQSLNFKDINNILGQLNKVHNR